MKQEKTTDSAISAEETSESDLRAENLRLRAEVAALHHALAARDEVKIDLDRRAKVIETALLALPVGVAVFDADDRLVIKNNRFQLYDAKGERDRPGTPFADILRFGIELGLYEDAKEYPDDWMEYRLRQRREPGPASIQEISDGRFIQIEDRRLDDGSLISAYTDVSQLKETEAALSLALGRSEAAGRSKSKFLAIMSHELRTPLNAIIGFSQLMMADGASKIPEERRRGYLSDIQFAAGHLHDLISDILELVRIETGQVKFEARLIDVVDLCEQVTRMFAREAKVNGIKLAFELTEGGASKDNVRLFDGRLVTQMLINLLTNSMRFTQEGGVINLRLALGADETRLAVVDSGVGMDASELEGVLEPFQQGSAVSVRDENGIGLGLSLTKGMVEMHGGKISFLSTEGVGTEAMLHFPLAAATSS
jgi:signal transduction histidine kinase